LQRPEIFTVCGDCPWTDGEEFSLSGDGNFFLQVFCEKNKQRRLVSDELNFF
jgi:hypothetical protein